MNSPGQTPLLIFSLSDPQDRLTSFHAKLFTRDLLSLKGSSLVHLNLNPPTEKSIDKILRQVAESEDLLMSDQQLVEVRC